MIYISILASTLLLKTGKRAEDEPLQYSLILEDLADSIHYVLASLYFNSIAVLTGCTVRDLGEARIVLEERLPEVRNCEYNMDTIKGINERCWIVYICFDNRDSFGSFLFSRVTRSGSGNAPDVPAEREELISYRSALRPSAFDKSEKYENMDIHLGTRNADNSDSFCHEFC